MRIAVVHSFYRSAEPSGENTVVQEQVEALAAAGHDVRLVERRSDDLVAARGSAALAAWTTASGRGPSPAGALGAFAPDVVHVHNTFPNWGTRWLREWGPRTVATLHNYRAHCSIATFFRDGHACTECLDTPVLPALVHRCYGGSRLRTLPLALATRPGGSLNNVGRLAARVVALNADAQQLFSRTLDRDIDLVPNFTVAGDVVSEPSSGFLYVGRFAPEKGVVQLVEGWPDGVALDVVGAGSLDPAVRAAAAGRAGIDVGTPLAREDLLRRLGSYTGLVVPSLWAEGLPTVVLEALGAGVPVVVSDRVAASAGLVRSGAAVAYDPDRPSTLAAAVRRVTRSGATMRTAARRLHGEEYSRDTWLRRMQRVYGEVALAQGPPRAGGTGPARG